MDDIRMFNTDALALEDIGALSNDVYDDSRLKLWMQMQDASDTQGNYDGTENGIASIPRASSTTANRLRVTA
jgi:hypothetical protein